MTPCLKPLLFLLLAVLPAGATVYYVDPDAGNNTNNGTATTTAWKQMPDMVEAIISQDTNGWAQLVNGDILIVKGGSTNYSRIEFTPSYYASSAAFDSIIIRSGHLHSTQWGTTRAIIDGGTNTAGFVIQNSVPGLTIDGFEIRNIAAGAVDRFSNQGYSGGTGSSCIFAGDSNNGFRYLTVKNCWLHDAIRTVDDTGHGIECAGRPQYLLVFHNLFGPGIGTKGIETLNVTFGVVSNNYFSGIGDHSIALSQSTNVDCCNNLIYNCPTNVHEPSFSIQIAACQNVDVWNNVLFRKEQTRHLSSGDPEDWAMGVGCYGGNLSNRVVLNTLAYFGSYDQYGNGSTAIALFRQNGWSDLGFVLQNNIIYECWSLGGGADQGASLIVYTNYASGESVRYNVFYSTTNTTDVCVQGTNGIDYAFVNVAGVEAIPMSWATYSNNVDANPAITGGTLPTGLDVNWRPNQSYFTLSASSPASVKTTGNAIYGDAQHGWNHSADKFQLDILGNVRTAWSMGAYEYGGSPPAPPAATGVRMLGWTVKEKTP